MSVSPSLPPSTPPPSPSPSPSSSAHQLTARQKSQFTYKDLSLLGQSSPASPLRCIALIDYDAFYAQCESVRLGLAEDQPLAVQQWQGLIAINYPARTYGLSRHVTAHEAQQKCPDIVLQHVATWREGDDKWAYRGSDTARHIQTDKVSLDPYRLESRKSLALVKQILPPSPVQRVEKASIDEVFLDLSAQIHGILLERFPRELNRPAPYDDPTELLPLPPASTSTSGSEPLWNPDDVLIDLDADQTEEEPPDWDDIVMSIGSSIVREIRQTIRSRLKYTCSAGIAGNKMLAKLGAGYKKPNRQTVVRTRAIQHFLAGYKFTQIRNLGGKLGDQIVQQFNTDTVEDLLKVPLPTLRGKLGYETGTWVYSVIRGEDRSEVVSRTAIKSMLSAKSFRPSVNSFEQAVKWLRIFAADICGRLVEEDDDDDGNNSNNSNNEDDNNNNNEERTESVAGAGGGWKNRRRPKTITLHHRDARSNQMRSKQLPLPAMTKPIDQNTLFELAKTLMGQFVVEGRAWPCSNLSLSVGGFEEVERTSGHYQQIGTFFTRTAAVTAAAATATATATAPAVERGGESEGEGINRDEGDDGDDGDNDDEDDHNSTYGDDELTSSSKKKRKRESMDDSNKNKDKDKNSITRLFKPDGYSADHDHDHDHAQNTDQEDSRLPLSYYYTCTECKQKIPELEREVHQDWHFAMTLQEEQQQQQQQQRQQQGQQQRQGQKQSNNTNRKGATTKNKRGKSGGGKTEKGQMKLVFG